MSKTRLPAIVWRPTPASSSRHGAEVSLVVVHRWGVRYVDRLHEARSYRGVVDYFMKRAQRASAHLVYPGSAVPGQVTQMVEWSRLAWAEAAYNAHADDVESADAIWLGDDHAGFVELARIVAQRLYARGLPPLWSTHRGFCRHADLGAAGGGHTSCPTTDLRLWRSFVGHVQAEHERGGLPRLWGKQ